MNDSKLNDGMIQWLNCCLLSPGIGKLFETKNVFRKSVLLWEPMIDFIAGVRKIFYKPTQKLDFHSFMISWIASNTFCRLTLGVFLFFSMD